MPVVLSTDSTPPVEKPNPVEVARPEFRGVMVDTRYEPATALLTHVEGMSWTVNYYSQVLDADNALSAQNQNRDAVYQQYRLIQRLELKVTTALNQSQDTTTKEFKVSGQASVYPCGLTPNEGDHFIADAGDGREAVFMITSSERRSIYKDGGFIIDYEMLAYSDTRIDDLNSKVVENLYYERDFVLYGQNPLISLNEKQLATQLRRYYEEILQFYFDKFVSREYRTLLVPGQEFPIYDPFLTKAVLKMFRDEDHEKLKYIRDLNVSDDDSYELYTVWDAFARKNRNVLKGGVKQTYLVNARAFTRDPMQNSIYHSGVQYVVYPADGVRTFDKQMSGTSIPASSVKIKATPTLMTDLFDLLSNIELNGLPQHDADCVNPTVDASYIFSDAFYHNTNTGQSALELLIQEYIDDKSYNLTALTKLGNSYLSWGPLEQFYQLPFLLAIMRSAIRRI